MLHLIQRPGSNPHAIESFKRACEEYHCELNVIESTMFDFSEDWNLSENDAVYCLSDDQTSRMVEKFILNDRTRHFYDDYRTAINKQYDSDDISNYLLHKRAGLPVINSVTGITKNKEVLSRIVEKLGGYPVVIKAIGGSKGHGVIRVDSEESLNSLDDYLVHQDDNFIIKEYIPEVKSLRVAVVGDKAVAAIEHVPLKGDFRANSGKGDHHTQTHDLSDETASIAVRAVRSLGFKAGGVDLSQDDSGNLYITEVNMPFAFKRLEKITGISVAKEMVNFLTRT